MSDDFFRTRMGVKFYESDVPRIATALESIAKSLATLAEKPAAKTKKPKISDHQTRKAEIEHFVDLKKAASHHQTGADSCSCGALWPCEEIK
jgi:hypothetical protein